MNVQQNKKPKTFVLENSFIDCAELIELIDKDLKDKSEAFPIRLIIPQEHDKYNVVVRIDIKLKDVES